MQIIRLDARGWRGRDDVFAALLPALGSADWVGANLDALFDSLSGGINKLEPPFTVIVDHVAALPPDVVAFLHRVETVFTDAMTEFGHDVRFLWREGTAAEHFRIRQARSAEDLGEIAALFEAYAATLPIDLDYQGFGAELAGLPGRYQPRGGELLLAHDPNGTAIGCVGMRPLPEPGCCEMKRLFVRAPARGTGLGRALAVSIVAIARERDYREMRLDTLDSMTGAIALYEAMGFKRIDAYYAPTPDGTVFMGLRL